MDVSFHDVSSTVTVRHPEVAAQDALAQQAMNLVVCLLEARGASMSWHSDSWPGLLALLCSPLQADVDDCLVQLDNDNLALLTCQTKAAASLFLKNMARMSPLTNAVMSDLCARVLPLGRGMAPADLSYAQSLSRDIWSSWGQSKVVEDGNKVVRDREERDTTKKRLAPGNQWAVLRGKGVIALHGRQEVTSAEADGVAARLTGKQLQALFDCRGHTETVDGGTLVGRRTWPSFSPQGSHGVFSQRALLQFCSELELRDLASQSWYAKFLCCFQ